MFQIKGLAQRVSVLALLLTLSACGGSGESSQTDADAYNRGIEQGDGSTAEGESLNFTSAFTVDAGPTQYAEKGTKVLLQGTTTAPTDGANLARYRWRQLKNGVFNTLQDTATHLPLSVDVDALASSDPVIFQFLVTDTLQRSRADVVALFSRDVEPYVSLSTQQLSGDEGSVVKLPVHLAYALEEPLTVHYRLREATDSSATPGVDVESCGVDCTVTFAPGATEASISLALVADGLTELSENFIVDITDAGIASIGLAQATVSINTQSEPVPVPQPQPQPQPEPQPQPNPQPQPEPEITNVSVNFTEPAVTLLESDASPVVVAFTIAPPFAEARILSVVATGSATRDDIDYPETITVNANAGEASFTVTALNDDMAEAIENLQLSLALQANGINLTSNTLAVSVRSNDVTATFEQTNAVLFESQKSSIPVQIQIDPPFTERTVLGVSQVRGTASSDDIEFPSVVTVEANASVASFLVAVKDDVLPETTETLNFELTALGGDFILKSNVLGISLVSDDVSVNFETAGITISESDDASVTVQVNIEPPFTDAKILNVVATGTASADDVDYPSTITVDANAGTATFNVAARNDEIVEPVENLQLSLSLQADGINLLSGQLNVTVNSDDVVTTFEQTSLSLSESQQGQQTVKIQVDPPFTQRTVLNVSHTGSATSDDIVFPSSVTFEANASAAAFNVTVKDDALTEVVETLNFELTSLAGNLSLKSNRLEISLSSDDVTAVFDKTTVALSESDPTSVVVQVQIDPPFAVTTTLGVMTDGTANAADLSFPGAITFEPNQSITSFELQANDDTVSEAVENLNLTLTLKMADLKLASGTLGVTISSNDIDAVSAGGHVTCIHQDTVGRQCWGDALSTGIHQARGEEFNWIFTFRNGYCGVKDKSTDCWGFSAKGFNIHKEIAVDDIRADNNHLCFFVKNQGVTCLVDNSITVEEVVYRDALGLTGNNFGVCVVNAANNDCKVALENQSFTDAEVTDWITNAAIVTFGSNIACGIQGENLKCWYTQVFNKTPTLFAVETVAAPAELVSTEYEVCITTAQGAKCLSPFSEKTEIVEKGLYRLTAGDAHVCGLRSNNALKCWGYNPYGEADEEVSQIGAGSGFACAQHGGKFNCWDAERESGGAYPPDTLGVISELDARFGLACAIDEKAQLTCWGSGYPEDLSVLAPIGVSLVAVGESFVCYQALGSGLQQVPLPVNTVNCTSSTFKQVQPKAPELFDVDKLVAGNSHACALKKGQVTCWGDDSSGQTVVPKALDSVFVTDIVATDFATCAVAENELVCWGQVSGTNFSKQIWNIDLLPVDVDLSQVWALEGGADFLCAGVAGKVGEPNKVVCWGNNYYGVQSYPGFINPTQLSTGSNYVCTVDNGHPLCWGSWGRNRRT